MEQRPLRLGDIVDDYCTRERRVTNHAIVAVVENVIRQTRCATCNTEHPYKGAREPKLRKKPGEAAESVAPAENVAMETEVVEAGSESVTEAANGDAPPADQADENDGAQPDDPQAGGAWLAHRRLIRASLPRTDNEPPPPRPIPEFTMHQRPPQRSRGFRFRGHGGGQGGTGNGQSPNGFGGYGNRQGNGGSGSGGGNGRPGRHRGKKRR